MRPSDPEFGIARAEKVIDKNGLCRKYLTRRTLMQVYRCAVGAPCRRECAPASCGLNRPDASASGSLQAAAPVQWERARITVSPLSTARARLALALAVPLAAGARLAGTGTTTNFLSPATNTVLPSSDSAMRVSKV